MKLKITCEAGGTPKVVNADTGEAVENVEAIDFRWDSDDYRPILLVDIKDVEAEINGDGVILVRGRHQ